MKRKERLELIESLEQKIIDKEGIEPLYELRIMYIKHENLWYRLMNEDIDITDKRVVNFKEKTRQYIDYLCAFIG